MEAEEKTVESVEPFEGSFKRAVNRNGRWMEIADQWAGWFMDLMVKKGDKIPLGHLRLIAARIADLRETAKHGDGEDGADIKLFYDMLDRLGYLDWQADMFSRGASKGGYVWHENVEKDANEDFEKYRSCPWW